VAPKSPEKLSKPHSLSSCLSQKLFNYQIKFNALYSTEGEGRSQLAFDPTKSFNNCKLLSQICLRTGKTRKAGKRWVVLGGKWGKHLPAYLGKHFSHFGVSHPSPVTKYLKAFDVRRTLSSEFEFDGKGQTNHYRRFCPPAIHINVSICLTPSIRNPIIFSLCTKSSCSRKK